jgi:hypothetical protein
MPSACNACGATGAPLAKVSLGHDFFGRVYDRLTPASDRSPAWYCPPCSEEKGMQLDLRAIREAAQAGPGGPLDPPGELDRAVARLRKIAARLAEGYQPGTPFHGRLLAAADVAAALSDLEKRAAGAAP